MILKLIQIFAWWVNEESRDQQENEREGHRSARKSTGKAVICSYLKGQFRGQDYVIYELGTSLYIYVST